MTLPSKKIHQLNNFPKEQYNHKELLDNFLEREYHQVQLSRVKVSLFFNFLEHEILFAKEPSLLALPDWNESCINLFKRIKLLDPKLLKRNL